MPRRYCYCHRAHHRRSSSNALAARRTLQLHCALSARLCLPVLLLETLVDSTQHDLRNTLRGHGQLSLPHNSLPVFSTCICTSSPSPGPASHRPPAARHYSPQTILHILRDLFSCCLRNITVVLLLLCSPALQPLSLFNFAKRALQICSFSLRLPLTVRLGARLSLRPLTFSSARQTCFRFHFELRSLCIIHTIAKQSLAQLKLPQMKSVVAQ